MKRESRRVICLAVLPHSHPDHPSLNPRLRLRRGGMARVNISLQGGTYFCLLVKVSYLYLLAFPFPSLIF